MNFRFLIATTGAALGVLAAAVPASAAMLDLAFSFDTTNALNQAVFVSGNIIVNEAQAVTIDAAQGYAISSISGTWTVQGGSPKSIAMVGVGGQIQSLSSFATISSPAPTFKEGLDSGKYYLQFDNIIFNPNTYNSAIDSYGFEFTTAAAGVSLFQGSNNVLTNVFDIWYNPNTDSVYENGHLVTNGSLSLVPLPGALPLFASAFFGIGAFAARRRAEKAA
jgi:hypothetical protein